MATGKTAKGAGSAGGGAKRAADAATALDHGHPCHACGAACCRYVGVALAPPKDRDDHDLIRWYLLHRRVCIYIDKDGDWWIQVDANCRHVRRDGSCAIYATRPQLCRDYSVDACERADHDSENVAEFTNADQFEAFFRLNYRYAGEKLRRRHRRYRTA